MAKTVEKRWYDRNGIPMVEVTNKYNGVVASISCPFDAVTDTLYADEAAYNAAVVAYEATITAAQNQMDTDRAANEAAAVVLQDAIITKLMATPVTPLTQAEADYLLKKKTI